MLIENVRGRTSNNGGRGKVREENQLPVSPFPPPLEVNRRTCMFGQKQGWRLGNLGRAQKRRLGRERERRRRRAALIKTSMPLM